MMDNLSTLVAGATPGGTNVIRVKGYRKHSPGCWRWMSHWQCAVDFVDRFRESSQKLLTAMDAGDAVALSGAAAELWQLVLETDDGSGFGSSTST